MYGNVSSDRAERAEARNNHHRVRVPADQIKGDAGAHVRREVFGRVTFGGGDDERGIVPVAAHNTTFQPTGRELAIPVSKLDKV